MKLLDIFLRNDGSFAWESLLILIVVFLAGWILRGLSAKNKIDKMHRQELAEWESKYKRLEGDYKNYKSNIAAMEKHNDKAVLEAGARVKALEGDIRALAEERKKLHGQLSAREDETRRLLRQIGEKEDVISGLREQHEKAKAEWSGSLEEARQSVARAQSWEGKARQAEADAVRAADAIAHAERKKQEAERKTLEAELRLKAVSEYAGKVGPLEQQLKEKERTIMQLREQIKPAEDIQNS